MKREIKFRAWHIEEKRFIDLNGFDIQFKGCSNPCSVYTIYEQGKIRAIAPQEYELMQFTGLKDKNGKEIFEGDICSVNAELNLGFAGKFYEVQIGAVVYGGLGSFCVKIGSVKVPIMHFIDNHKSLIHNTERIKIIGNIHENKIKL